MLHVNLQQPAADAALPTNSTATVRLQGWAAHVSWSGGMVQVLLVGDAERP
jgi:hypothetical protein